MLSNKITLEALKLKGFQNPTAIAEILNYVPNPNVALEMLLGVHEPKVVEIETSYRKHRHRDSIYELTGYDELAGKVMYTEYKQKTKTVYYLTKEDYTNRIIGIVKPDSKDYYTTGSAPANGYTLVPNQTMSIESFESDYSVITLDVVGEHFTEWNNYEVLIPTESNEL
jgi:hypothetical protein